MLLQKNSRVGKNLSGWSILDFFHHSTSRGLGQRSVRSCVTWTVVGLHPEEAAQLAQPGAMVHQAPIALHQKQCGLERRPSKRNTLPLSAGSGRVSPGMGRRPNLWERVTGDCYGHALSLQRVGHVLKNHQVWPDRMFTKHHAKVASRPHPTSHLPPGAAISTHVAAEEIPQWYAIVSFSNPRGQPM